MTRTQAEALATAACRLRPDWQHRGVLTMLEQVAGIATPTAAAVALMRLADDPSKGPGLLPLPGEHWQGTTTAERKPPTPCGEHPARRAIDCPECRDATADVDHARGAAGVRAALRRAPKLPTPEAIARDAEDRRVAHRGASA